MSFPLWMQEQLQHTEVALNARLVPAHIAPQRLHAAMRYVVLGGGKRVRALLCHATGSALGADATALVECACALELIHAYSLVHDDLPCMDNDVLRRGKPTCHVQFDEPTALLVGDALQTLAFRLLAGTLPGVASATQLTMIRLLADASGSRGMAGGQAIDLGAVGKPLVLAELEFMHLHKTGALIRASVLLGALCHGIDDEQLDLLGQFANRVGLLFQVVDDILDVAADTATLGKTAGKDIAANKPTFCSLLGLNGARAMASELHRDALALLEKAARGDTRFLRLQQITDFIIERRH